MDGDGSVGVACGHELDVVRHRHAIERLLRLHRSQQRALGHGMQDNCVDTSSCTFAAVV